MPSYPNINKQARSKSLNVTTPKAYKDVPVTLRITSHTRPTKANLQYELDGFGNQVGGFDTVAGHFGGVNHESIDVPVTKVVAYGGYKYLVTVTLPKKWKYEADKVKVVSSKFFSNAGYALQDNKGVQIYIS